MRQSLVEESFHHLLLWKEEPTFFQGTFEPEEYDFVEPWCWGRKKTKCMRKQVALLRCFCLFFVFAFVFFIVEALSDHGLLSNKEAKHPCNWPTHVLRSPINSFFFFFFFLAAPWHMKFPGQGSDLSLSHNLHNSWTMLGSLIHCAGSEIEHVFWHCKDTTYPIVPQRELLLSTS